MKECSGKDPLGHGQVGTPAPSIEAELVRTLEVDSRMDTTCIHVGDQPAAGLRVGDTDEVDEAR